MSANSKPTSEVGAVIKELYRYLLEKGHVFERGRASQDEGAALSGVAEAVRIYQGLGYAKLMQVGEPPVYALMERGRQETHIFQPQDPQILAWLEDHESSLKTPSGRADLVQRTGLSESDIPVADRPKRFHVTQLGDVYIITEEGAAP